MRFLIATLLLSTALAARSPVAIHNSADCRVGASLLYRPVIRAIWHKDEGPHPYAVASGFIRIAVHPTWDSEYFFDVSFNRSGDPTIIEYSLPDKTKTVTVMIERTLKANPCASPEWIADNIPIRRRSVPVTKELHGILDEFFSLRISPRKIPPDVVRLDGTEYELEFQGDDFFSFSSDDDEVVLVRWMNSFINASSPDRFQPTSNSSSQIDPIR